VNVNDPSAKFTATLHLICGTPMSYSHRAD
jgi:hypothetical protein